MTSSTDAQEPVQERLKDQVSVSIKEALDRANTVLTNLHRVQSYLDVIRILSTPRSGDVIKNALEQIHAARNDTATLLQHIYLTEIGLQSLQDFGNGGGLMGMSSGANGGTATSSSSSGATAPSANTLSSLMPILGATINSSGVASAVTVIDGVHESMIDELGTQELDFTSSSAADETEEQPPAKKM